MACYFFDIHANDLSQWDDDGEECQGRDEIVRYVTDLLKTRLRGHEGEQRIRLAVASVRDSMGNQVLTAMLGMRLGLRLTWAETSPSIGDHHAQSPASLPNGLG